MYDKIHRKGNLSRTLLLVNLIPTVLLLIAVILAFATIFIGEIEDDLEEINKMILANITDKIYYLTESQRMLSYEIYHNDAIRELLDNDSPNRERKLKARNYLNDVFISNKSFYSIYILNHNEIILHMGGSVRHEESHGDLYPVVSSVKDYFKPFPREINRGDESFPLVSVVFTRPAGEKRGESYLIVNHKTDSLLDGSMNMNSQVYYVTGGNEILLDYTESILEGRELRDLNSMIGQNDLSSQSQKLHYQGKEYIIHSVLTRDDSFRAVSVSDLKYFMRKTLRLRNRIIAIGIALLLAEMIVSLYFSKSIYQPIYRLFSSVSKGITGFDHGGSVKIHSKELTDSFNTFIERLNNLENYRGRTVERGRKNFLFRVLHGEKGFGEGDFQKVMAEYEMFKNPKGANIFGVVKIDGMAKLTQDHSAYSQAFQMASIEGVVQEQLNRFGEIITNGFSSSCLVFLLHGESPNQAISMGALKKSLEETRDIVNRMMGLSFTVGISPQFFSLSYLEFSHNYRLADLYSCYRFFLGPGKTITENDLTRFKKTGSVINASAKDIGSFLLRGDKMGFVGYLDRCWEQLREYRYEGVMSFFTTVVQEMNNKIQELYGKPSHNLTPRDSQKELEVLESYEELKEYLSAYFSRLSGVMEKSRQAITESTIKVILDYIDEELSNSQLSAYQAAEKIGVSPSHFSRLFHKYTGKKFPEYVMEIRLEHARKILSSEPGASIQEVGKAFGFSSNTYFTTSFKKKYGLPPSQYKNLHHSYPK